MVNSSPYSAIGADAGAAACSRTIFGLELVRRASGEEAGD